VLTSRKRSTITRRKTTREEEKSTAGRKKKKKKGYQLIFSWRKGFIFEREDKLKEKFVADIEFSKRKKKRGSNLARARKAARRRRKRRFLRSTSTGKEGKKKKGKEVYQALQHSLGKTSLKRVSAPSDKRKKKLGMKKREEEGRGNLSLSRGRGRKKGFFWPKELIELPGKSECKREKNEASRQADRKGKHLIS